MTATLETAAPVQPGLFDQKLPPRLILASFPVFTLPLIIALAVFHDQWLLQFFILLSVTHFVLTLSIYLQSENLHYFTASAKNVLLYFVVPLTILMGFYLIAVFQINTRFPIFGLCLSATIQLLNFNHLNRQTYGVYQLFKGRTALRLPGRIKSLESGFLGCLTAMLWITFLAGGICPLLQSPGVLTSAGIAPFTAPIVPVGVLKLIFALVALIACFCLISCVTILLKAWNEGGRPAGAGEALAYLGIQTIAACVGIANFSFFFVTQPTHSVEYHVLMHPRCFRTQLNEKSGVDRWLGGLRSNQPVFYGFVVLVAVIVMLARQLSGAAHLTLPYRALVSVFEGLFVFHYFVEMLVWRFSDPYFRRTLGSLYFKPKLRTT